ncbi:hypothetical protein OH76DRAFT_417960 [Lentinus brumalis]|uniref:Uncharacterized protein n=1 Tax=Lentinus brumalis TaxID=2498619 RepID=A0A371DW96_9APHY|nr:hypothetical protein OH76DRAFT_417960 [Polyporus brumalis]
MGISRRSLELTGTLRIGATSVDSSSSSGGKVEQEGEKPVGHPASQHESREPTLDYLDPPSDHVQAAAAPVDHPAPSRGVKRKSPDCPAVRARVPPRGVTYAQADEDLVKQEEIDLIHDILNNPEQFDRNSRAYLKQRKDTLEKRLVKRDPSPLRVPVRGEIIDLT